MNKLIYIIIIAVCAVSIYFGLTHRTADKSSLADGTIVDSGAGAANSSVNASSAPVAIGQVAQHYRPETPTPVENSSLASPAQVAQRDFQLTPDLIAKMYLIDTYHPGTCFGAPVAVPAVAIASLVGSNPPLSNFLKVKYGLATDLDIYNKIKQLQGVTLTETASSRFDFNFMDGQCKNVTNFIGVVTVSGATASATVSSQASHTYQ